MKAESIEQIREHLARGGLVTSDRGDVALYIDADGKIRYESPAGFTYRTTFNKGEWELLPLEEKPTRQYYYHVSKCRAEHSSDDTCICWHDEGTGPLRHHPEEIGRWREKPLTGIPASSLPLVTEDPTGEPCDNCEHCHGKGGRWDDESIDQWYWCEHCDAAQEYYAPILEKKKRKENRHHELRAKVLFGQPWSIEEQLEVWELLTGEKIEHGRRCEKCGGEGVTDSEYMALTNPPRVIMQKCPACINHPGYTVRPTWMGER